MHIDTQIKTIMLDRVKTVLLTPSIKVIQFFDKDDINLSNIPFTNIVKRSSAQYWFQQNNLDILLSSVLISGVVTKFKIDGQDGMTLIPNAITGTVGDYGSVADIKFNNTTWVVGSSVKLTRLYFFIR